MALRHIINKDFIRTTVTKNSTTQLYRSILKEIPRVMTIYDVDIPLVEARKAISYHFRKHGDIEDTDVINILIDRGYKELEETLMQWKQKTHLLRVLEPTDLNTYVQRTNPLEERNLTLENIKSQGVEKFF